MRIVLDSVPMDGVVVIGEGEKDEAPMLYNGEQIGDGSPTLTDIAVDPIDGTTLTAWGGATAPLAVIAVSERGTMYDPGPCVYMEKIAVGPDGVGVIDLKRPPADNIEALAQAKGTSPRHPAVILDRPRHEGPHRRGARHRGAHPPHPRRRRRRRHLDGVDRVGRRHPARHRRYARGRHHRGCPQSMGGELQGRLWPCDEQERAAAIAAGYDLDQVLTDDLVTGDNRFFAATGITDGELLKGVHFADRADAASLVMRSKSGTVRLINAQHQPSKLAAFSSIDFA